ncbi:aminotransferase class I/II-fold pyridoxal phosphate-dependent enzyme [Myxococcus llanfairpwllgwyngyllgogerychwyrndrobwllllantysiliogogogochensis]|uniref:Aminotransferase class I/II-fold pyridoxal phosphate-dependent enzyme n=1 Tax=Myxococcus llanfairpwllgwyngyllgogerychwyrndrobwllllantysiliogogogochensis TaxID=2590453 RepID=A0A540WRX3_9BACT|nr:MULTISPECIES: aminotransferase class I/II-fold pyridoxal phosphate-dependent enzyme [Myxococcus]NTX37949.1 aminotransferase class I/II-fold pyridoxal phosphate-dependent enzyme [Myxococcus sp. CA033]TQF11766.1 aminotransferase class I/II-fold pyridoxal phosphate-dependent enzyme [Myxococcus llanfairpwllgwyngyllgogerychwyrndrobwllllantysiliogogogochensis]
MRIPDFKLERYFARWEFAAPYTLCSSDIEGWKMRELLALAEPDALARWEELTLGYTEAPGLPALRLEIAALYQGVAPEQVLTFAGAQEAVFILMNVLLGPGDHAVVTWPGYQSLHEVARATGADVTLLPLREEDGWALDVDALRRALKPQTRIVVVNFPHNPTGALPDRKTFQALCALCDERGIYLLSDEVYRLLEHDPKDLLPAAVELSPRAFSLGVMSKAFGLAGLRVGWLVCRDEDVLRRCMAYKDYTTICNSAPSEVLALIALRAKERVLARSRALLASNLALLDAFFARHADTFHWVRPRAGSVAFPRLLREQHVARFTDALVQREGVLLLPGDVYDFPGNHFRLGLGRTSLPEALTRLERFVTDTR